MYDIVGFAFRKPQYIIGKPVHEWQQMFLADERAGARRHVDHAHPIAPFEDFRRSVIIAPREHVDFVAQRRQMSCDMGYVNVLSPGIHTASQGNRGSMLTDDCYF